MQQADSLEPSHHTDTARREEKQCIICLSYEYKKVALCKKLHQFKIPKNVCRTSSSLDPRELRTLSILHLKCSSVPKTGACLFIKSVKGWKRRQGLERERERLSERKREGVQDLPMSALSRPTIPAALLPFVCGNHPRSS